MIALIRLAVFGLAGLTVLYVLLSIYARSLERERLEKRWLAEGASGDRDTYVEAGLAVYRASLRRRLLVLVYVIPIVGVSVLVYVLNFS